MQKRVFPSAKKQTLIWTLISLFCVELILTPGNKPVFAKQHITAFPTAFSGTWNNKETLGSLDVPETGSLGLFSKNNSAYPLLLPPVPEDLQKPTTTESVPLDITTTTPIVPTDTPVFSSTTEPSSITPTTTQALLWHALQNFLAPTVFAKPTDKALEKQAEVEAKKEEKEAAKNNSTTTVPTPTTTHEISPTTTEIIPQTTTVDAPTTTIITSTTSSTLPVETTSSPSSTTSTFTLPEVTNTTQPNEQSFVISQNFIPNNTATALEPDMVLKDSRLIVSLGNELLPENSLQFYYQDGTEWKKLVTIKTDIQHDNSTQGYLSFDFPSAHTVGDLQTVAIKIVHIGPQKPADDARLFVDSLWVDAIVDGTSDDPANQTVTLVSKKKDFNLDEPVDMDFHYEKKVTTLSSVQSLLSTITTAVTGKSAPTSTDTISVQALVFGPDGKQIDTIEPIITSTNTTEFSVAMNSNVHKFKPGKFSLELTTFTPDGEQTKTQDFTWGVLAINTDKSVYLPGETAYLQMAALQDDGHTLCNAPLELTITAPSGMSSAPEIVQSGVCQANNVVNVPDYAAHFAVTETGLYALTLTNTSTGYSIADSFDVENSVPFTISRTAPTRIFPPALYSVTVTVTPSTDFTGTVTEHVPADFVLTNLAWTSSSTTSTTPIKTVVSGNEQRLISHVSWLAGQNNTFTYTFDAPDISPYMFLIGPLTLTNSSSTYQEARQWHIASDAVSIMDPNGDGNTSCVATPYGTQYTTLADGVRAMTTPITSNYITCANGQSDSFFMSDLTNVSSTTQIDVSLYANTGSPDMHWEIELWDGTETTQYGTTQSVTSTTSSSWFTSSFTGLNLNQTRLNDLKVKVTSVYAGTGSDMPSTISALYATASFTPVNDAPLVSAVSLNNSSDIILAENSTTTVQAIATVSDPNGYADIQQVTAKIYRSGVTSTESCIENDNNCYAVATCALSACSGNSCTATCPITMQYFAEPTDAGTPWDGQSWRAWIQASDSLAQTGSAYSPSQSCHVLSLIGINVVEPSINFSGDLIPGSITDPLNRTLTIQATGNSSLDLLLGSTDMTSTSTSSTIPSPYMHVAFATNTPFASSTAMTSSGTALAIDFNLPKPTNTTTIPSKQLWFGLQVPIPLAQGIYSGITNVMGSLDTPPWP